MKYLPWIISGMLSLAVAGTAIFYQQKLNAKEAEVEDLKTQMRTLHARAVSSLEEANRRYSELVSEANSRISAASMSEVDVRVRFREAFLSDGQVAMITNTGSRTAEFGITIERPQTEKRTQYDIVLDPNSTKEIGHQEGWPFISGDKLTISQPGHKSLTFSTP